MTLLWQSPMCESSLLLRPHKTYSPFNATSQNETSKLSLEYFFSFLFLNKEEVKIAYDVYLKVGQNVISINATLIKSQRKHNLKLYSSGVSSCPSVDVIVLFKLGHFILIIKKDIHASLV